MNANEIIRETMREEMRAERMRMVAKVQRKRSERERAIARRNARAIKFAAQGR